MSGKLKCDGCGHGIGMTDRFRRTGYIEPCDYCEKCFTVFKDFDARRRNIAFEMAKEYRERVKELRESFVSEQPNFRIPDPSMD